jgi:hypothetical protein
LADKIYQYPANPYLNSKHILTSMNYFDSDMSKSTITVIYCSELGLWSKENNWLNFIFLLISLFPLEIVLEYANSFLIPQGYVKLHIPNLSLSSLQCKGNNSIISCQELRCIIVNSFICCKVIQQYFKHYLLVLNIAEKLLAGR